MFISCDGFLANNVLCSVVLVKMRGSLLKAGRKKGKKGGIRKGTGTRTETKTGTRRGTETEVEIEIELGKGIETRNVIVITETVTGSGVREEKGSEIEMMIIIIGLKTMRGDTSVLIYCTAICFIFLVYLLQV